MSYTKNPDKIETTQKQSARRCVQGGGMGFFGFLAGDDIPDYASFLALVKEAGRYLNTFIPPEGFTPEGLSPEISLSAESAKALGVGSLRDFYSLALANEDARTVKGHEGRLPAFFPRGPESVRPVLNFIDLKCASLSKAIFELKRNWPSDEKGFEAAIRPLENTLSALEESRAGLTRVERDLWPRLKREALEWPQDAKSLWQKAQNLKQSVSPLLKASQADKAESYGDKLLDRPRRSLTRAIMELKNKVSKAKEITSHEEAWSKAYDNLMTDLDDYMAVVVGGNRSGRDWNSDRRWLSNCLSNLEKEDRRLRDETAQLSEDLKEALRNLVEMETQLSGHHSSEMLDGLEAVGRGVQALWRSTVERRRQMARVYFAIPSRLGRPVFLEKSMLATAQALGRAQSLLEDLRHQLSLAGSKLSTTHRLRSEGRSLSETLAHPQSRVSKIKIARKRLNVLAAVVDQRFFLVAAKGELESAVAREEEIEKQLNLGRQENARMYHELRAAALERERLIGQVASARQNLGEAGLVKARLLKVFARKSSTWDEAEKSRQKLLADSETLKAEKAELKLKRSKLATLYSRERSELKKLTVELKNNQGELARVQQYVELRHDLEKRLDETRREKDAVTARSREVEFQLQERSTQLMAAVAQVNSLSVELARHREELAAASKVRLSLGEKAAALRRRQDILSRAHDSLREVLKRKNDQLIRSEAGRDVLIVKLNRQKKNLLRLVATRQQLRAELGAARLHTFDLEKERDEIFSQLKNAQSVIEQSDRDKGELNVLAKGLSAEKTILAEQIATVSREKDALLARLEALEGEKRLAAGQFAARYKALEEKDYFLAEQRAREKEELRLRLESVEKELREETGLQAARLAEAEREKEELLLRLESLEKELEAQARLDSGQLKAEGSEKERLRLRLESVEKELREETGLQAARLAEAEREKEELLLRLESLEKELEAKANLDSERTAAASEEKEKLSLRLRELEEDNRRLASVEEESNIIKARLSGLEEEKGRLSSLVSDLEKRNEELGRNLTALEANVSEELFPFIKILGEALWRSEAQLKRARGASDRLMERFNLEFEVREANLRLRAVGRELELAANAKKEKEALGQQLVSLEAEHQALIEERDRLGRRNRTLHRAIGTLNSRYVSRLEESLEKQNRLTGLMSGQADELNAQRVLLKDKDEELAANRTVLAGKDDELNTQKAVLSGAEAELDAQRHLLISREQELISQKHLLASQEQELNLQKDKLAKLEPLVSYFIASAGINSETDSGFNDIDPELLTYLKEAGKALGLEMAADDSFSGREGETSAQLFEMPDPADLPLIARLKSRLNEIQPLVSFLARSFVVGVAELAQARQERSFLNEELSELRKEREHFQAETEKMREEDAGLKAELDRLSRENIALAYSADNAVSTRTILESSLISREAELSELRDQAFVLAQAKDQFQANLDARKKEINLLKSELAQADRDLTENDGRLEAAWAAMNYLATRASDALGNLKNKLETQARQVDNLSLELKRREMIINSLEERQNKLALLYWALVSRAATAEPGQLAAQTSTPALSLPMGGGGSFLEVTDDFEETELLEKADNANSSGGHNMGRGILESVKKVARRSLFTLILAGGLVMPGPLETDAAQNNLNHRGDIVVASFSEPDPQFQSCLDSAYIGRTVSLEKVETKLRLAGRPAVEKRLAEMIAELAAGHGLTNVEFLRLMRAARSPENTVYLDEFKGRQGGLILLGFHFPKLSRQMLLWPPETLAEDQFGSLLKNASDFKPSEGGFWERMYFDLTAAGRKPQEALSFIVDTLAQKKLRAESVRPEYAGRLAPFPQLENLGSDRFITFMTDYINNNWQVLAGRGRQRAAHRLAGDIYFAARLYKLPTTLFASVLHEESEVDQLDFFRRGSTFAIHARAADLADLTTGFTLTWQEGHPPLCDLDEALAASEKEAFVEGVYRKKMSLVMAYNKTMNSGNSLFDAL